MQNGAEPTILVVDDEPSNCELLQQILDGEGYHVELAKNGLEALQRLHEVHPHLVLMDVLMPELDGIEACRRIRAEGEESWTPVIFVTALDDVKSRIKGKEAGGDDFLSKPISSAELLARVKVLLKAKASRDRQAMELEQAKEELVRAERLATLGTLAAGVGHELKNIAVVLRSVCGEMRRMAPGALPDPELVADLVTATEHVNNHASALLALGKPGPSTEERLDLKTVAASTIDMLQKTGRTKHIEVTLVAEDGKAMVRANRTRLEQVFFNLVGNAADAFEGVKSTDRRVTVELSPRDDGRILCQVTDNGCGMTPEIKARLFQPYFTTKAPGKGTGLGLSVVRRIVQGYGGKLALESEAGKGTTFTFDLPGT